MRFLDTNFGDKRGKNYFFKINVENNGLTSLEGSPDEVFSNYHCSFNKLKDLKGRPKEIDGSFVCSDNELISLEGRPKNITNKFYCKNNPKLKNIKEQIIKYGIKAKSYITDNGDFSFIDIKEEFNRYYIELSKKKKEEKLKTLEKEKNIKKEIKKNYKKLKNIDYGLSL